jgi:hypothetical protein
MNPIKITLSQVFACAILFRVAVRCWAAGPAEVYFVIGADTAIWNDGTTVDVRTRRPHYPSDLFTDPAGPAYAVMDAALRERYRDSYGQTLKLTWWMMAGNIFRDADNVNVPIANTMNLYLMKKYHGDALRGFGDELTLHYHTFVWSDYSGAGAFYWNQSRTFNECREDFDVTVAQYLLEEGVFPVSFRSGWHFMDEGWQQHLNELLPYCLHNNWPAAVGWPAGQPVAGVENWSLATSMFIPFHPSSTNYQVAGDGPGWNVRSVKMPGVSAAMVAGIFAQAAAGTPQVVCFWSHLPENYVVSVANTTALIEQAAMNQPEVRFRYCTATEAMQRWLGQTNVAPPELDVTESLEGQTVRLAIHTHTAIFQPQPFVGCRDVFQQYRVVACTILGDQDWSATLPVPRNLVAKVGIAVTDPVGNLATRILKYLPDDVYIDNLDPQYAERSGQWASTTNAAWGSDARVALVTSADTARVEWALPVSWAGPHDLFAQVPAISNAAGNVVFGVYAGAAKVLAVTFPAALPPNQWVLVGTPYLDPAQSNWLEMVVQGSPQGDAFAVADVVKLTPHGLPPGGFIGSVTVDPADTTANIVWRTTDGATGGVEYGADFRFGGVSSGEARPVRNHVVTLTGLTPGTNYYFNIHATNGEARSEYPGVFRTADYAYQTTRVPIFELTNNWRYSTANLDGINWTAREYDDTGWEGSGPGLLWVDDRTTGPDPGVQPKNTLLPADPGNHGFPYITYYFRTHFEYSNDVNGAVLTFSNYLDDGAVFYLNGVEIYRDNMAPAPAAISNATLATGFHCGGDAVCPVVFSVSGAPLASLTRGDNVLAVEVHNYSVDSPDITFGLALSYHRPYIPDARLNSLREEDGETVYWNGVGYSLQQTSRVGAPGTEWTDVPGPITQSPYALTNRATGFYRLRR